MLSVDAWLELIERLDRHRFRTALTMLSVAWGILMLVLLLAAGNGLENNVRWKFRDDAIDSIWLYPGHTSKPWKGHPVGAKIQLTDADYRAVRALPGVQYISARYYLQDGSQISYGGRHGSFDVRCVHPDHKYIEQTIVIEGRFLDDLDLAQRRRVAVIGKAVSKFLFRGADPLGAWIDVAGDLFRVVGVFDDVGGPGELRKVYLPITTAQAIYGGTHDIDQLMFTIGGASLGESTMLADRVRGLMARRHHFDPHDPRALHVRNNLEHFERIDQVFVWLRRFIWIVGVGTVLAGVVGVSNIMLVSVKERTREIGLRKALGAVPASIVTMVLQEAVVLTSVAGYAGLVAGVAIVEVVRRVIPENNYIRDPQVDLWVVGGAVVLLVVFGTLAGLFPALRAASVDPIVALRDE